MVRMLKAQADKADTGGAAAALVVGPYGDFRIRVWERPGIDEESIYGPASDLRRLGHLLESRLAAVQPNQEFALGDEYTADVEYRLVFDVREETFDPASVVPAIVQSEASPEEEGFTASGSLRMGVSEMTRFGMEAEDLGELAELIRDVVIHQSIVKAKVAELRKRFLDMRYCFSSDELQERIQELHRLV